MGSGAGKVMYGTRLQGFNLRLEGVGLWAYTYNLHGIIGQALSSGLAV